MKVTVSAGWRWSCSPSDSSYLVQNKISYRASSFKRHGSDKLFQRRRYPIALSRNLNFQDHIKMIMCPLMQAVTFIDQQKRMLTYKFSNLEQNGCPERFLTRIKYAKSMIERLMNDTKETTKVNVGVVIDAKNLPRQITVNAGRLPTTSSNVHLSTVAASAADPSMISAGSGRRWLPLVNVSVYEHPCHSRTRLSCTTSFISVRFF